MVAAQSRTASRHAERRSQRRVRQVDIQYSIFIVFSFSNAVFIVTSLSNHSGRKSKNITCRSVYSQLRGMVLWRGFVARLVMLLGHRPSRFLVSMVRPKTHERPAAGAF